MRCNGTIFSVWYGMQYRHSFIPRSQRMNLHVVRTYCSPVPKRPETKTAMEMAMILFHRMTEVGKVFGRNSLKRISTTVKSWWDRYEEFVGLNEVRDAQGKVTEAEKVFMVARGIVREARESIEAHQIKLKEVRDRLDRVSREDTQYLELATLEHRLLQSIPVPEGKELTSIRFFFSLNASQSFICIQLRLVTVCTMAPVMGVSGLCGPCWRHYCSAISQEAARLKEKNSKEGVHLAFVTCQRAGPLKNC
ncbi:mitochondrial potassium channel isoform X3 [Gopherus flavomarginatus]|uniref:mitochondrial potassium channel isoform X3 n=1 Tax=Gopherus flavomarginatus TaxID=286002 RepID=UPI0021CBC3BA|nr:mitochondrial potassium channel isoform X3 [Gopherus flavomarginatus]